MRRAFACFASPSVRNDPDDDASPARVRTFQAANRPGAKDSGRKGTERCKQSPSGAAGVTGLADYSEADVLHHVQGKCCDLVFVSAKLQDPRIATWLEQQGLSLQELDAYHGSSEDLLSKMLGAERAQAAMEAVQQGVPYKAVLESPDDGQAGLAHSAPNPRSLLPAQLACPSGPSPWLSSKVNQLPSLVPFSTQVTAAEQGAGNSDAEGLGEHSPLEETEVKVQNPPYESKPVAAVKSSSCGSSSSSFLFGSQLSSITQSSGGTLREDVPSAGTSTHLTPNPPHTLPTQGGSGLILHPGPFLLPPLDSQSCCKAPVQEVALEQPEHAPSRPPSKDADLSQSLISKAQGLSNTALERIRRPSIDNQNHDRTLAMLQTLKVDRSPDTSNQPLPSFQAMCEMSSITGNAYPNLDLGRFQAHPPAALVPVLGKPATVASSAADIAAPTARRFPLTKEPERAPMCKLEDIAEEAVRRRSEERQRPLQGRLSHTSERAIEISVRPIQTRPGGSKPLAMINFADISEQVQVQGFLLSLAESQLLLLSSLLPKHAIDFLARQSSATDAIPLNMAKLARSHEAVTLLFLDICGFTELARSVEPQEVMGLLNTLFSSFDKLTDQNVTKVETAGDCYIVSAGVLSSNSHDGFSHTLDRHSAPEASARRVMEFAKAMLQEAAKIMMPRSATPVQVRVGMHTGNVVSGLIGTKLPKFSIFGDAMNTAARMESTGVPGRIHVSEATHSLLQHEKWEPTVGGVQVKGKGMMQTYLWVPDPTSGPMQKGQAGPLPAATSEKLPCTLCNSGLIDPSERQGQNAHVPLEAK